MDDALGHRVGLVDIESDGVAVLEVDEQLALEGEEELIFVVVLVPVEVPFDDPEPYDGVIDPGTRDSLGAFGADTPAK